MMTIITTVTLRDGMEPAWDEAMRERLEAARAQPGWIGGQLLMPIDALNKRIIVGTWETRAAWEAWHTDEAFAQTRERLEGLESGPSEHSWHETLLDLHPATAVW
jgi:heme-degrading monooxygenase HmoA